MGILLLACVGGFLVLSQFAMGNQPAQLFQRDALVATLALSLTFTLVLTKGRGFLGAAKTFLIGGKLNPADKKNAGKFFKTALYCSQVGLLGILAFTITQMIQHGLVDPSKMGESVATGYLSIFYVAILGISVAGPLAVKLGAFPEDGKGGDRLSSFRSISYMLQGFGIGFTVELFIRTMATMNNSNALSFNILSGFAVIPVCAAAVWVASRRLKKAEKWSVSAIQLPNRTAPMIGVWAYMAVSAVLILLAVQPNSKGSSHNERGPASKNSCK